MRELEVKNPGSAVFAVVPSFAQMCALFNLGTEIAGVEEIHRQSLEYRAQTAEAIRQQLIGMSAKKKK